jgi:L-ascorbate metabolism protein UlaG (beta-lactamase superfamily)
MKITYFGHSAFLVEARDGTRLILDPYLSGGLDGSIAYEPIDEEADVVIASHYHEAHAATYTIPGEPLILLEPSSATVGMVKINGLHVFHDGSNGSERGTNTIVILDDGDVRLVHLGDLGHKLDLETVEAIGKVDVLLAPVGGHSTIDAQTAADIVNALAPAVVVPMHYWSERLDLPMAPLANFLATQANVEYRNGAKLELTRMVLPGLRVTAVLKAACGRESELWRLGL